MRGYHWRLPRRLDTGLPHPAIPSPRAATGANLSVAPFFLCRKKTLEQAAGRHRDRFGLPDDQVIKHPNAHQPQCLT
jgi:hypothetical protein